jgi:hypothetical protein
MKKATFNTTMTVGKRQVSGYISNNFGIHKYANRYEVTHLASGLNVYWFDRLRQAREFVKRLEQSEIPWGEVTPENSSKFAEQTADGLKNLHR